jgi:histidinol-phosphatase
VKQVYPTDANFFLVKVTDADGIYRYLMGKGIIVRNRTHEYHCQGCLRLTVGSKAENQALLAALTGVERMNRQPVLFVDRDGVIVVEDQVDSWEKIRYIPGVFNGLGRIKREGPFYLVMVSNQDGVGTPSFPFDHFYPIHQRIMDTLSGEGILFDAVHIDFSLPSDNCPGRKPGTAMLEEYRSERFDLANSLVIGDRLTDVQLAKNLGCKAIWFAPKTQFVLLEEHPELKDSVALISDNWNDVACFILGDGRHATRQATVTRETKETQIRLSVNLDGTGTGHITTGIGFFDHMLEQIVRHTGFDIDLHAHGRSGGGRTPHGGGRGHHVGGGGAPGVGGQTGHLPLWMRTASHGRCACPVRHRLLRTSGSGVGLHVQTGVRRFVPDGDGGAFLQVLFGQQPLQPQPEGQ